jgi:Ser/Thr protein kinase RdoA (MazF antagonist)
MADTEAGMEAGPITADFVMPPAPSIPPEQALRLLRRHYGLQGRARPLDSERDRIFHIMVEDGVEDGRDYLLRLANPAETPEVSSLQTAVLAHIATRAPGLPVQRILPALSGRLEEPVDYGAGRMGIARLLTFLPGRPLRDGPIGAAQRQAVGGVTALLALAMRDFHHPAAGHALYWDIQHLLRLRGLVPCIADAPGRELALRVLEDFATRVQPELATLRAQVLHDDLHPGNILVDPADPSRITGLLDFGDTVRTALVNDLAVAANHHVALEGHPLAGVAGIVGAYHAVLPLEPREVALLPRLIAARLLIGVLVRSWQARETPGAVPPPVFARAALERLAAVPLDEARAPLFRACGMEIPA